VDTNYDALFEKYERGQRDELVVALRPWLQLWARDVLANTRHAPNGTWRRDLIAAGVAKLYGELDKRIAGRWISCGKHLINSLRRAIKKEMRAEFTRQFPVPIPSWETRQARKARGVAEYKPWELRRRRDLPTSTALVKKRPDPVEAKLTVALVAPEPDRRRRHWRYVKLGCDAAVREVTGVEARFIEDMLQGEGSSVPKIARKHGVRRKVVDETLRRIGSAVIVTASPELKELGQELDPQVWEVAETTARGWNGNVRTSGTPVRRRTYRLTSTRPTTGRPRLEAKPRSLSGFPSPDPAEGGKGPRGGESRQDDAHFPGVSIRSESASTRDVHGPASDHPPSGVRNPMLDPT
jgi:hypothetical protein